MKPAAMRICNAYPGLAATGIYGSTVGVPPIWHGERGKTVNGQTREIFAELMSVIECYRPDDPNSKAYGRFAAAATDALIRCQALIWAAMDKQRVPQTSIDETGDIIGDEFRMLARELRRPGV